MHKMNNIAVLFNLEFSEFKTLTPLTWLCLYYSDDNIKNDQQLLNSFDDSRLVYMDKKNVHMTPDYTSCCKIREKL